MNVFTYLKKKMSKPRKRKFQRVGSTHFSRVQGREPKYLKTENSDPLGKPYLMYKAM